MKNKSDANVMLKEAGILFAITLIAGLLLGVVNELTVEPIRIQQEKAVQEACRAVFETAASFEELQFTPEPELQEELAGMGVKIGSVYEAAGSDGALQGYVVESVSTEGYGGNIVLYLGVTLDGTLNDISILEISETAGLGMLAPEELVPQFHQKNVDSFVYTKTGAAAENEIDAMAGATITTKAVTNAVNGGLKAANALMGGGQNE
ncbi:FMN-binding protein [Acetatifactor muris]|uniref:Ion-translocating oxidoreductase complex subunit G n=1 Tax=Acetatifactor muris TaxID=879566 RepID=A0A2K4ZBT9_9FIRM|nr:FMN-binding protein [Acetatifactor muris]MCR2046503.1 FMN-binding protein [Acetatifactor muris]SOY27929.1 Electron transport complex protein RnfG [Acetatifactor muris]